MKTSQEGIDLIKRFEGCKLKSYKALPSEKYYTIGYGHYSSTVKKGMTITQKQAEYFLKNDLEKFEIYVDAYTKSLDLNQHQFDALVSFTYNCGPGNLKKLVAGRTIDQIAEKIIDFNHANGKEHAGLTKRRKAEQELFMRRDMKIIIGSARIAEDGSVAGAAGDQKQKSTPDYVGEVSLQEFYIHSKGWYVLRPKNPSVAEDMAGLMRTACNNPNIGYNQNKRLDILTHGIFTTQPTSCDCGTLVRECIREAAGRDPGNFTTANEAAKLEESKLFEPRIPYTQGMLLYEGDVLVTKVTKGHTVIVVEGYKREMNLTNSATIKKGNEIKVTLPTIKLGSTGDAVALWCIILGEVLIVRIFDEELENKTKDFQKKHGLEVDGIVGKNSWTKGFELL